MSLKSEAIDAISKLPDDAGIDEIMYSLYIVSKVREGRTAIKNGKKITTAELKKEIQSWLSP